MELLFQCRPLMCFDFPLSRRHKPAIITVRVQDISKLLNGFQQQLIRPVGPSIDDPPLDFDQLQCSQLLSDLRVWLRFIRHK